MKDLSSFQHHFSALTRVLLVVGGLLLGGPASPAGTLITCTERESGDFLDRGFYIPSYPGISLETATLEFSGNLAGGYTVTLTARQNTYSGAILGSAMASFVLNGDTRQSKPVTFHFPSAKIVKGSRVCFVFKINTIPARGATLYYSIPGFTGGCKDVIQTDGTTAPLDSFRRYGVVLTITGRDDLHVSSGGVIQPAIDHADPGDTVLVGPGTYTEDIVLRSDVHVIGAGFSSTLLRGTGTRNVVTANNVTNTRLEGFKITRSGADHAYAGVSVNGGSPSINNNWIIGNINGIRLYGGSSAIIRNNIIEANGDETTTPLDYGIICLSSTPLIANNLIVNNAGVGIYFAWAESSGAQAINNTIVGNTSNGIWCYQDANALLKNNVLTDNMTGISASHGSTLPLISFNNVWKNRWLDYDSQAGGTAAPGLGDISVDPLFDVASSLRYMLAKGSPCIDAGDPAPIYNDRDGTRNDMGAYGGPSGMMAGLVGPFTSGFLFNNIGKIPTSEITRNGSLAGLANVSSTLASALAIYPYKDAPFGGWLWIHGLFGTSDTNVNYYKIYAAKWNGNTPPGPGDFKPILDPLTKIQYTIAADGKVIATPVSVGPDALGFYKRTDSGYWSFPDLKMIWNTHRLENGRYDLVCEAYRYNTGLSLIKPLAIPGVLIDLNPPLNLPTNDLSRITVTIDNTPVTAVIESVRDRAGNVIPECGLVNLGSNTDDLQFEIRAFHPNGFLREYILYSLFGRNRSGGIVARDQYVGSHDGSRPSWPGPNPTTIHATAGFESGALLPWTTCSYQFRLEAYARTTDGFTHIYGTGFDDHYFLNLGGIPGGGCQSADLDGDGDVDGADLALFSAQFGKTADKTLPAPER
ncbi:MAG TPA: right-handed parallel beta-helix repeat-containing protein [Candidatus Paceibacterota bacterium]|nr:right-handed parallel beta-helix repeat-containing protein [Verrucomicrobiota bacterium]HRY47574.1 right-handed parallel beta-helix repeat-containing protein [Candidatus Paceibacterota bacterium]HRZ99223.1 right-handed parallel beta-helix repeat-containing protein [Candidatus Paceibacterota bacterium]